MVSPGLTPGGAAGSGSRWLSQDNYHPSSDYYHTSTYDNHDYDAAAYHYYNNDNCAHNDYDEAYNAARDHHNDVATCDVDFDNILYHHGTRDLNNYADNICYHYHDIRWGTTHPG